MNKRAYILLLPLANAGGRASYRTADGTIAWSGGWVAPVSDLSLRPVRWTVVGGSSAHEVVSGRTVPITVEAEIAKGWHIYSLTQKSGGPIPLRLDVLGASDVLLRGVINAPKPDRTFDKNFGIETELYSGNPRFTIPVGVPSRSPSGIRKFQIGARYQVCSDKVCLPPRTDTLGVAIRITARR